MKRSISIQGFAAMPMVTSMALILTLSLLMLMRSGMMQHDQASRAQLAADYHQREEAILRALVTVFPRKAIACMKANHAPSDDYSWSRIFADSIELSAAAETLPPEMLASLGLQRARHVDVGDQSAAAVQSWITSLTGTADAVTPGITANASIFTQAEYAGKVPPMLQLSSDLADADAVRPIVSLSKIYSSQATGLLADVSVYPLYNLIPYPNIRFGYAEPGQPFVAKHNWWAFKVTYGARGSGGADMPGSVTKTYVLSLYEIPSQMPIEAARVMAIGQHNDGTSWNASTVSIDGSIYGQQLDVKGSYGASRLAARQAIQMDAPLDLQGTTVDENFDALGIREQLQADKKIEALPIALSPNSGRLAFFPIKPGDAFLQRPADTSSQTAWQYYTAGGGKCRVTVEATSMVSYEDQTPVALRVTFASTGGGSSQVTLQRGSNWPTLHQAGGDVIPFQTELTNNGRACLTFYPSRMAAWLAANGGADVAVNNSVWFSTLASASDPTVRVLSSPPAAEDMCVIIRKGKDLTGFTRGLSLITPTRIYVGDDLNAVPLSTPPVGSGLDSSAVYFPPMSIFGAELRIGTTPFNRPTEHHGQILSVSSSSDTTTWQPLDIKSGSDDIVHTDTIAAQLTRLHSPAELPPVHPMNWLIVVEELSPP